MDQLRAERARFESELATGGSPGVVPETPLGEGGHEPSSSSSSQPRNDEDSVWDSDDDERPADGNAGGGTARTPMPSELLARGASVSETRDDAAAAAGDDDDDDLLPVVGEDFVASIRSALDQVESLGVRASIAASSQMRSFHAKRGDAMTTPGGAPSPVTPVIGAAALAALKAADGEGANEDPEAKAYLKGVLRMLYDGHEGDAGTRDGGDDSATPSSAPPHHPEGADLAPETMTPLIERAVAGPIERWVKLTDDPDRETVVARYVARSPLHADTAGAGAMPPTPGLPPTPVDAAGPAAGPATDSQLATNAQLANAAGGDDDGFAFDARPAAPAEGKMSYRSMRAQQQTTQTMRQRRVANEFSADSAPSMLDELRELKARFAASASIDGSLPSDAPSATPSATPSAPSAPSNAAGHPEAELRFKGGWDEDVGLDLSPLPDETDVVGDLSPEVSFRLDKDDDDDEEEEEEEEVSMTPSRALAAQGTPTSKPRVGASGPHATPRSPPSGNSAALAGSSGALSKPGLQRVGPGSPAGPLDLAPSPPQAKYTANPSATPSATPSANVIKPQVREALVALDPIAGSNVAPGQPAWSAVMTAQVRAAHARKEEARSKVEDLLGGGFDYDALRQMAKRAHEELKAPIGGFELGTSKSRTPNPVFAAGAKASTLVRPAPARQGPFARGAVYAPPPSSRGTRGVDDDAVRHFEDAVLNPALELDPDASVEGFRAAIAAEVSARIAASKGAVKAEATQLYKASASGAYAWRAGLERRAEFGVEADGKRGAAEPATEFIVGDGSIGRAGGKPGAGKKPAFGVAEGHYRGADPKATIARVVRTTAAGKGGNHGYPDRRFVKGKWAEPPPKPKPRAKSAPPAGRPKGPTLAADRHGRDSGSSARRAIASRSSGDRFSDGEDFDDDDDEKEEEEEEEEEDGIKEEDGITATVRRAAAMRREAAASLARRREERMSNAARARAEAELRRTAEAEASVAEAEKRRERAEKEAKRRLKRRPVAFGGRVDVPKGAPKGGPESRTESRPGATDSDGTKPQPTRDEDGKLIPRPFKLSEPKPRNTRGGRPGFEDRERDGECDDENAPPPPRDPDVWESPEEEKARLEREARERATKAKRRKELAERANEYGTRMAAGGLNAKGAAVAVTPGADAKRRSLQETFHEARRRRGEELERNAERARSRETLRQSAVVAAAAQVAAPAIAAAEAAQRNASSAAAAAAKAARAAAAAEALMMAEARRLRERRKRLYAAGNEGADIDGADIDGDIDVTAWGRTRTDGMPGLSASFDDAVPLMASLGDGELHAMSHRQVAGNPRMNDGRVDSGELPAELPDADADAPVPSPSPEKAKESLDNLGHLGDSRMEDDEKVSESRKSDAPSPIAGMTPGGDSPGGDSSRDAGAEGAEGGADDKSSPVAIRTNPGDRNRQMFETSIAEDAAALADALPPETADKVDKTSRRVAERRRRNEGRGGGGTNANANTGLSPPTPPTPRSPAVTWRVGARALPAPLRQPVFESGGHLRGEAVTSGASALIEAPPTERGGAAGADEAVAGRVAVGPRGAFAIKAAEARAAAMAELAPLEISTPDDSSLATRGADGVSTSASTSASMSASGGEARAPAAPKFLRGGDLYEYVPPERIVDGFDDDAEETMADDSGDDDWLRRGLTADSSDFDRTALTDGRSTLTGGGRSESTHPDLSLTRSATAAIAREMTRGGDGHVSGFYIRRSHPEGRAALAAALAGEESDLSDVASSVESLE